MNRKLLLLGIGMTILSSCSKEPDDIILENKTSILHLTEAEAERLPLLSDNHRRTSETVLNIAESYLKTVQPESKAAGNLLISDSVLLSDVPTKGASLSAAPIYVVSRGENKGFILVAGDNRIVPILGFTDYGDYDEGENPCFDIVLDQLKDDILMTLVAKESLRDSIYNNLRIKLGLEKKLGTKSDDGLLPDPPGAPDLDVPDNFDRMEVVERDMYFENEYEYGPLLKTKWGQRSPYDSEVVKTHPNCPVGCVATSTAQIMAYHKHPAYLAATGHTYLWNQFPNNSSIWSADAVASIGYLMADLGLPQYLDMNYTPGGSGASCERNLDRVLTAFRYTYDRPLFNSHRAYSYSDIVHSIMNNMPVHICGNNNKLKENEYEGHAWVVDGALSQDCFVTYYALFYLGDQMIREIKGATGKISSTSTVHHNFGWNGLRDGWYVSLERRHCPEIPGLPDPSHYRQNLKIVTGIRPQ